jgi:hypothetical protein
MVNKNFVDFSASSLRYFGSKFGIHTRVDPQVRDLFLSYEAFLEKSRLLLRQQNFALSF